MSGKYIGITMLVTILCCAGCAGVTKLKPKIDKDITLDNIKSIEIGIKESVVIDRLGRPMYFGVDDEGTEYLHYENASLENNSYVIPTPIIGGDSSKYKMRGFAAHIYIKDGLVSNISYSVIQANE